MTLIVGADSTVVKCGSSSDSKKEKKKTKLFFFIHSCNSLSHTDLSILHRLSPKTKRNNHSMARLYFCYFYMIMISQCVRMRLGRGGKCAQATMKFSYSIVLTWSIGYSTQWFGNNEMQRSRNEFIIHFMRAYALAGRICLWLLLLLLNARRCSIFVPKIELLVLLPGNRCRIDRISLYLCAMSAKTGFFFSFKSFVSNALCVPF